MKVLKQTDDYTIYQKRSGRHAVKGADRKWINGEEKVKILLEAGLIKVSAPAAPAEPEPAEETAAEEAPAEAAEQSEPEEEKDGEEEKSA